MCGGGGGYIRGSLNAYGSLRLQCIQYTSKYAYILILDGVKIEWLPCLPYAVPSSNADIIISPISILPIVSLELLIKTIFIELHLSTEMAMGNDQSNP